MNIERLGSRSAAEDPLHRDRRPLQAFVDQNEILAEVLAGPRSLSPTIQDPRSGELAANRDIG
jgi:hypothetical protein